MTRFLGKKLAHFLSQKNRYIGLVPATNSHKLMACLQPGDVFLVEGHTRFSTAIQYLTQSTWSHSAMFVGFRWPNDSARTDHCFVEADVEEGVRSIGLSEFAQLQSRICRPVGLSHQEREQLCQFVLNRIGFFQDGVNFIAALVFGFAVDKVKCVAEFSKKGFGFFQIFNRKVDKYLR